MLQYKLKLMLAIDDCVLAVYYSPKRAYQLLIIDEFNCVYDYPEIFYTQEAAEIEGIEAVKELL